LLFVCTLFFVAQAQVIEFNAVYPVSNGFKLMQISIITLQGTETLIMDTNKQDNITHKTLFQPTTPISSMKDVQYQYAVTFTNNTKIVETFWRVLEPCRILSSDESKWETKYEYFQQSETDLGLSKVPQLAAGITQPKPFYSDDNQVMTVSFEISQEDLDGIIFNPNDRGEIYVKSNMTMVSLTNRDYYESMKIRRAGGASLGLYPYSYQIKFTREVQGIEEEVVVKLKGYPNDYRGTNANIIAEKTASDICLSVGAPINYVSFVRVIINGEYQGIYGMLEKIDESFIERRWPYHDSGKGVGSLYKIERSQWYLLTNDSWQSGIRSFCEEQTTSAGSCCPCFENDCDVDSDCDVFDDDDEICQTLSCCKCTWESNGSVDTQTANCVEQTPFQDFVTLGDAVLSEQSSAIQAILNSASYIRSTLCSLAVMNADGYTYNGKNYYWYRDVVSGQFFLILYDQDIAFTRNSYVNENLTPWDWTMKDNLSDALFLGVLLKDEDLLRDYNSLLESFVANFYRPDQKGPLFERMETLSSFVQKYNPARTGVESKTYSYINYFITPLSQRLYQQLEMTSLPNPNSFAFSCNATAVN